jgi:hypothetical protein
MKDEPRSFEKRGMVEEVLLREGRSVRLTTPVDEIQLFVREGIKYDYHAGRRLATIRDREGMAFYLPPNAEVLPIREVSLISVEDLEHIQQTAGLPWPIVRGAFGENIVVSGIPNFSRLPSGTVVYFVKSGSQYASAAVYITRENGPCITLVEMVRPFYPEVDGFDKALLSAANHHRGLVGMIYSSGKVKKGYEVIAVLPPQHLYLDQDN